MKKIRRLLFLVVRLSLEKTRVILKQTLLYPCAFYLNTSPDKRGARHPLKNCVKFGNFSQYNLMRTKDQKRGNQQTKIFFSSTKCAIQPANHSSWISGNSFSFASLSSGIRTTTTGESPDETKQQLKEKVETIQKQSQKKAVQ